MASVAHRYDLGDTANATGYTSGSFTPTAGDQLVVGIVCFNETEVSATLSESAGGGTYTLIEVQEFVGTASTMYVFVRDQLVGASPPSRTLTFTLSPGSDTSGGAIWMVEAVTGLSLAGTAAVVQSNSVKGASGATPAITFGAACDTANPTVAFYATPENPPGDSPPAGWTTLVGTGHVSPTGGGQASGRASGFTGTTLTWQSAAAGGWGVVALELDASSAGLDLDLGDVPSASAAHGIDLAQDGPDTLLLGGVAGASAAHGVDLTAGGPDALLLGDIPSTGSVHGIDLATAELSLDLGDIPSTEVVNGIDLTAAGPDALLLGDIPSGEAVQGIDLTAAGPDALLLGDIPSTEVVHGIDLSVPAAIPLELGHIPPDTFPPVTQPAYKSLRVDPYAGSSALSAQLDEAVTNGAEHVRFAALWNLVETADGTFSWTSLDNAVNGCLSRGLKCTLHIIKTPTWVGTDTGWDPPIHDGTQINHWRDWITELVTRFGTDIDIYEIWNEPNGSSFWDSPSAQSAWPAEYATLLRNAAEAARAVDPDVKIGGMNTNRSLVSGWLEAVYDALEADVGVPTCQANGYYFDYLSLHPYCLTHDPDFAAGGDDIADAWGGDIGRSFNDFTRSRDIVEAREGATKPIYFGEFGYNTDGSTNNGPVADATRATYLTHAYDVCRADGGVYALTWYSWQDGPAVWDIDGTATETAFIAYSMSSPSGGGPVYGIEFSLEAGLTLDLGTVPSGEAVQGVDLTQAGPDVLSLGKVDSPGDLFGITLSISGADSLLLGNIPSDVTVRSVTLSKSGAVSLALGHVDGSITVHGLDLSVSAAVEGGLVVAQLDFDAGSGRVEYEDGVLLSEYSDVVKVVEF